MSIKSYAFYLIITALGAMLATMGIIDHATHSMDPCPRPPVMEHPY